MADECKSKSSDALTRELHLAYKTILALEEENERLKEEISEVYTQIGGIMDEAV